MEELINNEDIDRMSDDEFNASLRYGLIMVHKSQLSLNNLGEEMAVEHFCGYINKPGQKEIDALRQEIIDDAEYELPFPIEQYEIMLLEEIVVLSV